MFALVSWQQLLIRKHQPCHYRLIGGWAATSPLRAFIGGVCPGSWRPSSDSNSDPVHFSRTILMISSIRHFYIYVNEWSKVVQNF